MLQRCDRDLRDLVEWLREFLVVPTHARTHAAVGSVDIVGSVAAVTHKFANSLRFSSSDGGSMAKRFSSLAPSGCATSLYPLPSCRSQIWAARSNTHAPLAPARQWKNTSFSSSGTSLITDRSSVDVTMLTHERAFDRAPSVMLAPVLKSALCAQRFTIRYMSSSATAIFAAELLSRVTRMSRILSCTCTLSLSFCSASNISNGGVVRTGLNAGCQHTVQREGARDCTYGTECGWVRRALIRVFRLIDAAWAVDPRA